MQFPVADSSPQVLLQALAGAMPLAEAAPPASMPALREPQAEPDQLARTWRRRIERSREHWERHFRRVRHNRALVSGFNKSADPETEDYNRHRANLIQGTITAVLPNIYSRNPELSVTPRYTQQNLKLFCTTLQNVTNRYLERADLKGRAKATVRSALTASYGIVKVMYQRDIAEDPLIRGRMNDTQDNILEIEGLLADLQDPDQQAELEERKAELEQLMRSLEERVEVEAAEGLVVDRVLTEHLLIDDSVLEFMDYKEARWMCQLVPMSRKDAEHRYKLKLDRATAYRADGAATRKDGRLASAVSGHEARDDDQILVFEIWDKITQTVYTLADGCDFWLREPYSPPKVGERWYPFFLLPFQLVDGQFVAPSLVDLTEKLQSEHNSARDRFNRHRDLAIPGWVAAGDTSEKSLKNFAKSVDVSGFGEITIIDTDGKPLTQVITPRQHPAIDPMVYDTSAVRSDWEQVTGMQDAARSTVVKAKTATEAGIMDRALSGRVSEFRDQTEDWLSELSGYAAQILLLELTEAQVERIMGPPEPRMVQTSFGQVETLVKPYDWPQLTRAYIFDLVELKIRAGSTGAPNKLEEQESWGKVMPVVEGLVGKIMQARASGMDAEPFIALLRETIRRFDDRLEVEQFIPKAPAMPSLPGLPGAGGTAPSVPAIAAPAQAIA